MDERFERRVGVSAPPSALRPPPLFRSIESSGLCSRAPPHRRLRSIFGRSRAVLPANAHNTEASDIHTFTDILTGNHASTCLYPLRCNGALSEDNQSNKVLNTFGPEMDLDLQRTAVLTSGVFANTSSFNSPGPQVQSGKQDRLRFCPLSPSPRVNSRNKGRQGRLVTPLQTSDEPVIKAKQHQKRGKKVDCATKYVAPPSLSKKDEDARLCEWLQSLGIAESKESENSITTNNQRRLFESRCSAKSRETDAAVSHRRDRRPHFLPPIYQSGSLLQVPLLLPENSPPPSPCSYPDALIRPLPVPPLQPGSSRRK